MENFSDSTHPLKILLQLHLATDTAAAQNLPYILKALSSECLAPSSHLTKWTARITSLIHSKQIHARWAGLRLAHRTSLYSRSLLIENAQNWLGVALPNLSRKETPQVLEASLHLCRIIFCNATDVPEFQRQVSIPNVPKFTAAVLVLLDSGGCACGFKVLLLRTLTKMVSSYPTLHRASHLSLSTLSLKLLDGNAPSPTHSDVLHAASQLYATLPITGGKVGATNLWKKSIEDTIDFGWSALSFLQNALKQSGNHPPIEQPQVTIPLNVDRLRSCVIVLGDLFGSDVQRSVQVPIGSLVSFAVALLALSNGQERNSTYLDLNAYATAAFVVPEVWRHGCELITSLSRQTGQYLAPHSSRIVQSLTYHLERQSAYSKGLPFLTTLEAVLSNSLPHHSEATCNRVARAMIPLISKVLPSQSDVESKEDSGTIKTKKKRRQAGAFEGDEIFKTSRDILFPTPEDGDVILAACRVFQLILRSPSISPSTHSIASRVILSVLLVLLQCSPTSISRDVYLHGRLVTQIQTTATELGCGTTNAMSKSLALVMRASSLSNDDGHIFDLLNHPRVPPLVRSMPHVETLSLFRAEESNEEASTREALGLTTISSLPVVEAIAPAAPLRQSSPLPTTFLPAVPTTAFSSTPKSSIITTPETIDIADVKMTDATQTFKPASAAIKPTYVAPTLLPAVIPTAIEDEENEEMPAIDMDSDSD